MFLGLWTSDKNPEWMMGSRKFDWQSHCCQGLHIATPVLGVLLGLWMWRLYLFIKRENEWKRRERWQSILEERNQVLVDIRLRLPQKSSFFQECSSWWNVFTYVQNRLHFSVSGPLLLPVGSGHEDLKRCFQHLSGSAETSNTIHGKPSYASRVNNDL